MNFKIEKKIPVPFSSSKYPFGKMEVGDSFFIKEKEVVLNSVSSAAHHYGKHNNKKFSIRKAENGYRIWRIK